ncbi:MAG: DNA-directed RNA polymerase subunit omega [Phycisphaerales bacterium]
MIEALKSDEIVAKAGGRFKLCTLIQRRLEQLIEGARPLVEREGRSDLELVIEEILQDKITLTFDAVTPVDGSAPAPALAGADEPLL